MVELRNPAIENDQLRQDQESSLAEARNEAKKLLPGEKEFIKMSSRTLDVATPYQNVDIDHNPEIQMIADSMISLSDEFRDIPKPDDKENAIHNLTIDNIPLKRIGRDNDYHLGNFVSRQEGYIDKSDNTAHVQVKYQIDNKDWKKGSNLDSLAEKEPNSHFETIMTAHYDDQGNLTGADLIVKASRRQTNTTLQSEMNYVLVDDGKWMKVEDEERIASQNEFNAADEYLDSVGQLERKHRTLNLTDDEHDKYMENLIKLQNQEDHDSFSHQELEKLAREMLDVNPEDIRKDDQEPGQMVAIDLSTKNYRFIANTSVTVGTNAIFTGKDSRDFSKWYSYDKETGNMTRLFEEV